MRVRTGPGRRRIRRKPGARSRRRPRTLRKLTADAIAEPFLREPPKKRRYLLGKATRVCEPLVRDFMEGQDNVSKPPAMTLDHWLQAILAGRRRVIELSEGSTFGEVLTMLMPMMDHEFAVEWRDASAQKQARRLMERLQAQGFYATASTEAAA